MSIPLYFSDRESGTFARSYISKYRTITKRIHRECSREYCHAPAAKMYRCFYRNGSYQLAFICSSQTNKETIPCGLI